MMGIGARVRVVASARLQRLVLPLHGYKPSQARLTSSLRSKDSSAYTSWDMPLTSWDMPGLYSPPEDFQTVKFEDDALAKLLSETVGDEEDALTIQRATARMGVKELSDMQYVRPLDLYNQGVPVVVARKFLDACKPPSEKLSNSVNLLRLSQGLDSLPFKKVAVARGPITESEVRAAQQRWGQSIVQIGDAFLEKKDYVACAADAIDELYAYGRHNVLFKPTKAASSQFRSGRKDALSYFVGGDETHLEDTGFAITPWTNVRFEAFNLTALDDITLAMGNYYFTDTTGKETKVEYTFGYWRDEDGSLRIVLHHSSLPFKNVGPITESEVHAAQDRWGRSIVDIGRAYLDGKDYVVLAEQVLDELYAYGDHDVLFKPTKAANVQFRSGRKDALSYFVGGNDAHPEDAGFAITPWTAVRFEPSGMTTLEDSTVAMGNYYFTDTSGQEAKVEYTFGYWRDPDGEVRIVLHHSSLPFQQ